MDPITQQTVLAAAGAGGGDPVYVDDVFSTFVYEGNGSTQSINNGIDLAGEGGLTWFKKRNGTTYGGLWDTERGVTKRLRPDNTDAESTASNLVTSFNSNGVSISATGGTQINNNNDDYVSWTFRKAPGFFDVVTYTGNGTAGRTVSHNLGSVPGMIIVKCTNVAEPWAVYHRSLGNTKYLSLSETSAEQSSVLRWNNTTPTSSVFTVGSDPNVNQNTKTYVAYIFAHDDQSFGTGGNESIIKCGTYTGTGAANNTVNLGFEPQWVMLKSTSSGNAQPWFMLDNMRGAPNGGDTAYIFANDISAEASTAIITFNATGFAIEATGAGTNGSGQNYIYMAIRRPNKPPEAGTEVFQSLTYSGNSTDTTRSTNILVDFLFTQRTTGGTPYAIDRMRGTDRYLSTSSGGAGDTQPSAFKEFGNDYIKMGNGSIANETGNDYLLSMFKRAPGFMDVVAYSGTASNLNVSHNLGVAPEFLIVKRRQAEDWTCYHSSLGNTKYITLNSSSAAGSLSTGWNNTDPTSTVFTVGTHSRTNGSGFTYIAYLFATLPGISKVGSYTGTGSALNIDCGFTAGARFVLIKRTDTGGNWFVLDTVRGIVSGNDPLLELNSTSAQDSSYDNLDPYNQGFTVTAYGGTSPYLNISGGTYLFLAIA